MNFLGFKGEINFVSTPRRCEDRAERTRVTIEINTYDKDRSRDKLLIRADTNILAPIIKHINSMISHITNILFT